MEFGRSKLQEEWGWGFLWAKHKKDDCHSKHYHENLITSITVFVITDVSGTDSSHIL